MQLRTLLQVNADEHVVFERYSDSTASYVTLESDKPQIYKTLFRAAKAKLKLRLRATVPGEQPEASALGLGPDPEVVSRHVLSLEHPSTDTLRPQTAVPVSPVIARSPVGNPPAPKFEPISPVSPAQPLHTETPARTCKATEQLAFEQTLTIQSGPADSSCKLDNRMDIAPALAFRPKPSVCTSWVVYCNNCNHPMEDDHFHCGVCDGGDYDLCPGCVDNGIHCPGTGHWMVKRSIKNGSVVNSTTQRIPPKVKAEETKEVPGAYTDEKQSVASDDEPTRTCNCCVKSLPEKEFVTCLSCEDYDLCMNCHMGNKHGHHPGHAFTAAISDAALPTLADFLCNSGRNVRHSAVCDGCDKFIYGVRHKCLNCPDWDYCSNCVKSAKHIHPRHRFVPIYDPLAEPLTSGNRHYGIYCDGPLCNGENVSYIEGVRYKCAVCHDTDFCQNCEAHPSNRHNHTHPLIKFKTPVRSVCVTTVNDDKNTQVLTRLGDYQAPRRSTATETTPVAPPANAATQVQTIVDLKPSAGSTAKMEKIAIRDLLVESVEPVHEKVVVEDNRSVTAEPSIGDSTNDGLDAHFIRDTILDGSKINAGYQFVQVWTLRNPGPNAWPAGCSVRHVGGDNMLNIDNTRPLSHAELADASESNVVGRSVEAGEELSFRVILKAPQREGTAISYWRLKTADGIPFGHRLWCDINVVTPPAFPIQQTTVPTPSGPIAPQSEDSMYERLAQKNLHKMKALQQARAQHAQKLETLNMATVQRARKAAIERLLESRRREHEAALATIKHEEPEVTQQSTAELPVEEKPAERAPELESSRMIFPQLDKESPESSTYESTTTVQPDSPKSEKSTVARTVTVTSDDEFFEDAESVALHSDDEGFETDEEYDILDASDEDLS
jgi:next-to-BRCA1 protein 1